MLKCSNSNYMLKCSNTTSIQLFLYFIIYHIISYLDIHICPCPYFSIRRVVKNPRQQLSLSLEEPPTKPRCVWTWFLRLLRPPCGTPSPSTSDSHRPYYPSNNPSNISFQLCSLLITSLHLLSSLFNVAAYVSYLYPPAMPSAIFLLYFKATLSI